MRLITNKETKLILTTTGVKFQHAATICGISPTQFSRFIQSNTELPREQMERLTVYINKLKTIM